MPLKKNFNQVFKQTKKRSYTYIMSKEGRTMKSVPTLKLLKYTGGNVKVSQIPNCIRHEVISVEDSLWLDSSMEEFRKLISKQLKPLGANSYYYRFRVNPLQILRHHKMASKGKVDRISMGMRLAFGSPFCMAAGLKKNTVCLELFSKDQKVANGLITTSNHILTHHAPFNFLIRELPNTEIVLDAQ